MADGVFLKMRRFLLVSHNPNTRPRYRSNQYVMWAFFPRSKRPRELEFRPFYSETLFSEFCLFMFGRCCQYFDDTATALFEGQSGHCCMYRDAKETVRSILHLTFTCVEPVSTVLVFVVKCFE
jgi:hypothetical protein